MNQNFYRFLNSFPTLVNTLEAQRVHESIVSDGQVVLPPSPFPERKQLLTQPFSLANEQLIFAQGERGVKLEWLSGHRLTRPGDLHLHTAKFG